MTHKRLIFGLVVFDSNKCAFLTGWVRSRLISNGRSIFLSSNKLSDPIPETAVHTINRDLRTGVEIVSTPDHLKSM